MAGSVLNTVRVLPNLLLSLKISQRDYTYLESSFVECSVRQEWKVKAYHQDLVSLSFFTAKTGLGYKRGKRKQQEKAVFHHHFFEKGCGL